MYRKRPILQRNILDTISRFLVDPIRNIEDIDQLRLSRLLSSILLLTITLLIFLFVVRASANVSTTFELIVRAALVGVVLLAYVLVRMARLGLANGIIVLSSTISLFMLTVFDTAVSRLQPLNYLIIVILYSSIFLSLPIAIVIFIVHLAGLLIIPLIITDITLSQIIAGPLSFNLTLGLFTIIMMRHRDLLEAEREAQLAKSEQFLNNIFDAIQAGISIVDRDLNIRRTNRWMEEMYADQAPLVGCKCYAVYQGQTSICSWCPTIQTLETGQTFTEIVPYPSAAEPAGWVELTSFPMLTENGQVEGAIEYIRDISEQKRIEIELRKLSRAVEQSPASVVITDVSGAIEYVNPKFTQLTGYTKEDAAGQNPRILKSGYTDPAVHKKLWETITSGVVWRGEFVNKKKNGELYWEFASISPVKNDQGQITHFVSVKEDISERKQVEEELARHREHLEALVEERTVKLRRQNEFVKSVLESLAYPFYVLNVNDYSLAMANEAALQGRAIENLTCYQLAHAQDAPCSGLQHPCPLQKVRLTNKPFRTQHEHVTSEGETRIVEVYAYPIFDEDGQVRQMIEYTQDITEHKQAERKLWLSEHRYRSLFEAANDAVFIIDLQGNHLTANRTATLMLGYDLEELIGLSFRDIVVPEEQYQSENVLNKLLAGESLPIYERVFRRKNGERFPVEVNVLLVQDQAGKPLHIQSIVRDISRRKQAEQKLVSAYEQLKELDHLKSEFVSSVSHELRTPVTNLKLYHHLLSIRPDKLDKYLATLQQQTLRLEEIVESMLYMLKIQQQIVRPEIVALDVNGLVTKVVASQQIHAQKRDKTLVHLPYPEEVRILGDSDLLEQAVSVLLDNAVKYSPPQEHVTIALRVGEIDGQEWVMISVSDTGPGIPPEEASHIFGKFFRGKAALETGTPGAGLGLAIAQAIVEEHHGRIAFQNAAAPDCRTVFSIWLPLYSGK